MFDRIKQMKRGLLIVLWLASVASVGTQQRPTEQEAVQQYCVTCHNDRLKTSGLSLEKLDVAHAAANPDVWERVERKLQARTMPPQGSRRPDESTYRALLTAIDTALDAEAVAHPNPGAPILHRLNRSEYANAV